MMKLLLWVGLIARKHDGSIAWPFYIAPLHCWVTFVKHPVGMTKFYGVVYLFRNVPGVIKRKEGRLLPRRWGFGILGLIEFGDRGH